MGRGAFSARGIVSLGPSIVFVPLCVGRRCRSSIGPGLSTTNVPAICVSCRTRGLRGRRHSVRTVNGTLNGRRHTTRLGRFCASRIAGIASHVGGVDGPGPGICVRANGRKPRKTNITCDDGIT